LQVENRASESNGCACDYLSMTRHFSRAQEMTEEQYYCERIALLILFDSGVPPGV